jgi:cytochrome P450
MEPFRNVSFIMSPPSLSRQDVDEELIIDECMTILFAGHDTTGIWSA